MIDNKKKRILLYILGFFVILGLGFLLLTFFKNKNVLSGQSGLFVTVSQGSAEVYFDDKMLGNTPYESWDIKPGNHTIKLKNADFTYEVSVPFNAHPKEIPQVVINRDLGVSKKFSSGQNFWIDYKDLSSKLSVISEPSQAKVYIDDIEVGKTPYSSAVLSDGEYDLRVEKDGYESQTSRIKIKNNYKLNVSAQLFLVPVTAKAPFVAGTKVMYDLSSDLEDLLLDTKTWVKGVIYYSNTRAVGPKFAYFIDYLGNVFDASGQLLESSVKPVLKTNENIAYLGRKSDLNVTSEAKLAALRFSIVATDVAGVGPSTSGTSGSSTSTGGTSTGTTGLTSSSKIGKYVKVIETGTGWLRVRSTPSTSGTEVAKLNVGDVVVVLDEKSGWYKIKTGAGVEGWISATYTTVVQ